MPRAGSCSKLQQSARACFLPLEAPPLMCRWLRNNLRQCRCFACTFCGCRVLIYYMLPFYYHTHSIRQELCLTRGKWRPQGWFWQLVLSYLRKYKTVGHRTLATYNMLVGLICHKICTTRIHCMQLVTIYKKYIYIHTHGNHPRLCSCGDTCRARSMTKFAFVNKSVLAPSI